MPDPSALPFARQAKRVAKQTILAGLMITLLKFGAFLLTNSVSVLSDAVESIINIIAASFMLFAIWFSNRPADRSHPYGHGKVEFMAVAVEGLFVTGAGVMVAFTAVARLIHGGAPHRLDAGLVLVGFTALLGAALTVYVYAAGRRYRNATLRADAKHLATDVATTLGVLLGLGLVRLTGLVWLDPVVAIVLAVLILVTGGRLLREAVDGLMDRSDPEDDRVILAILDDEIKAGRIRGYHKVRHRHTGAFHWVDMHLQFDGAMAVTDAHRIASGIEHRIEDALKSGDATAHIEPAAESP